MYWKLFALNAALLVITISATPSNVAAQVAFDATKKMRVAAVVGVGITQKLNLYYVNVHSATPHQSEPGIEGVTIVLQNPNPAGHEGVCTKTIHAQVNGTPGLLNTLSLGITSEEEGKNKKLLLNGVVQEPPLGDCFDETNRVIFLAGHFSESVPNTSSAAFPRKNVSILMYDIQDSSGATAASGSVNEGFYILLSPLPTRH